MNQVKFVTEEGEELSPNEMIQKLMKRVSDLEYRVRSHEINCRCNEDVISFPDYPQAAAYVPFESFGGAGTDTISFSLNDDR